jgi:hypothetical protein
LGVQEDLISALWGSQDFHADQIDLLWQKKMSAATEKLGRATGNFPDAIRATQKAALAFGRSKALEKLVNGAVTESYIIGKLFIAERDRQIREDGSLQEAPESFRVNKAGKSPASKITASVDLSVADTAALEGLTEQANVWFRDSKGAAYFDAKAIKAINEEAALLIKEGKSASAIASAMKEKVDALYGVGDFSARGRSYWGGVAEHAATSAGVAGQLTEMVSLGWNRYEIVNPMDERTTPICQHLNGKTLFVSAGVAEINKVANASDPDEVKAVKPFAPGGSAALVEKIIGTGIGASDLSMKQSSALSEAGFATPPFHFRCRSYVDISFSDGDSIPDY